MTERRQLRDLIGERSDKGVGGRAVGVREARDTKEMRLVRILLEMLNSTLMKPAQVDSE